MKKIFHKIFILIIIFIILMINISIAVPGKLNDSYVRVRSAPSTEGTKILTNLNVNDSVDVIEKTGDWYKIQTESGITGYIFAQYVDVTGTVPLAGETSKPKQEEPKVEQLNPAELEEQVEVVESEIKEVILPTVVLLEEVKGKYMPLIYSSEKVTYNKDETLKILDEKALWSKVTNDTVESWILTSKLMIEEE